MLRDPRDIFISYYFQLTKRNDPAKQVYSKIGFPPIDWESIPIGDLLVHQYFGIYWIIQYINLWYDALDSFKKSYLIQYEKIKNDPHEEFSRLLDFILEEKINPLALEKAIQETSFKKMKENERKKLHFEYELSADTPNDDDSFKVRRGKIGGYKDYLNIDEIQYMNKMMEKLHPKLKKLYQF